MNLARITKLTETALAPAEKGWLAWKEDESVEVKRLGKFEFGLAVLEC